MLLTWHIVLKDLRRLRPWLALLLATILARYAAAHFFGSLPADGGHFIDNWDLDEMTNWSLLGISLVCSAIIAALLVHEDPVTGTRGFWTTRPIAASRLLSAKIIALLLALMLLPTALQLVWWQLHDYSIAHIAAQLPSMLARHATTAAVAFFSALLTRNLGHFILSAILCTLAFSALMAALAQLAPRAWIVHTKTWPVLMITIVIVGISAAILTQYLTRRIRLTIAIIASIYFLCFFISALWRWPFVKPIQYFEKFPQLTDDSEILVQCETLGKGVHEQYARNRSSRADALRAELSAQNIPEGCVIEFVDPSLKPSPLTARMDTTQLAIETALTSGPSRQTGLATITTAPRSDEPPVIEPGQTMTARLLLRRAQIVARLPLANGAQARAGAFSTRIVGFTDEAKTVQLAPGVAVRAGGFKSLTILVNETTPSHLIDPVSRYIEENSFLQRRFAFSAREGYFLLRDNQIIASLALSKGGMNSRGGINGNPISTDGVQYARLRLRFPDVVITESELPRYELLRVVTPIIGTLERTVALPTPPNP